MDAFLEYQKDIGGLDLEAMEAKYRILSQFHDNEDKQSDDEEEGDTQCSGVKGSGFDFGNYALDDKSAMDCSSLYSDYAASQILQASIEAHLESHLARMKWKLKPVPKLDQTVDQEAQTDERQKGDEEDMDNKSDNNGNDHENDENEKDDGKDDITDVQMEREDILIKDTENNCQENIQENLDQNLG
ncbi:hypothetical protein BG000_002261 [Podila horticola]|nr:hypothetical protein BG000_002261 [Podila horticola]